VARLEIPPGEGGDAVQIWSLQPALGAAATRLVDAAYNKSILPVRVREAARMRIAQLNDCTVCLAFRADKVRAQGLDESFYGAVGSPDEAALSEQERLAVAYAERFAIDHTSIDDAFMEKMRAAFTDPEILDLTICIGEWLAFGRLTMVLDLDEATWDAQLDITLRHAFFSLQAGARAMVAGSGGTMVFVSSVSGLFSSASHAAYGAGKAGLLSLVRSAAEELGPEGLRINAVVPGSVSTPRIVALREAGLLAPWEKHPSPIGPPAETADIAAAILFLSCDLSRNVTGPSWMRSAISMKPN